MIPEFLYREEKKKEDGLVILLEAFIQLDRKTGTDALEDLHDNDKQNDRQQHDQIFIAVVAVVDGDLAQTAAADNTAHGGVA